jgi:hypothetical protein
MLNEAKPLAKKAFSCELCVETLGHVLRAFVITSQNSEVRNQNTRAGARPDF